MQVDGSNPHSSRHDWLWIAGIGMVVMAAIAQGVVIGISWGIHPFDLCDEPTWSERIACLHPQSYNVASGALQGWCVAAIALPLARYLTPYISVVLPGGFIGLLTWVIHRALQREFGPAGWLTSEHINTFAELIGMAAILFVCPVVGAWLVGWRARRRRHQSRLQPA